MSEDNKKYLKYLGIIFISVIISYKLPHDSYSIIEYIIRPIRYKNSVTQLAGIVPLILFIIGIRGIFMLEKNKEKSKIFIFLVTVFIIIPIMKWSLGVVRTSYHGIMDDGLNSLDIVESSINLNGVNDELTINMDLNVIDYGSGYNKFNVRVYLPESLSNYVGKEYYEFENGYRTYGHKAEISINEEIPINKKYDNTLDDLYHTQWEWEPVKYEFYNDDQVVEIIDRGI